MIWRWTCVALLATTMIFSVPAHAFDPQRNPFASLGELGGVLGGAAVQQLNEQSAARTEREAGGAAPPPAGPPPIEERALRAVLMNGAESYANVDGQMVRLGEAIDNWRLTEVKPYSAVFHQAGRQFVLELQRPQSGAASAAVVPAPATVPAQDDGATAAAMVGQINGRAR